MLSELVNIQAPTCGQHSLKKWIKCHRANDHQGSKHIPMSVLRLAYVHSQNSGGLPDSKPNEQTSCTPRASAGFIKSCPRDQMI